jgi:broad specificity phosphatase PhoE
MPTTIILVRHGQTEWNRVERFRGHLDVPLNPAGLKQAALTAQWIKRYWKPAAIYASPLSRAAQTAGEIARVLGSYVQLSNGILDTNYGKWQGLTPDEARAQWPDLIQNWYEHPQTVRIPDGETLSEVRARAFSALKEFCWLHADQEIVVVSHTDVIRLILMAAMDIENDHFWRLRQDNCAISVIENTDEIYSVRFMNCKFHLQ